MRRVNRRSAVSALSLTAWQRYRLDARGTGTFRRPDGEIFYLIYHSDGTPEGAPPDIFVFKNEIELSDSQIAAIPESRDTWTDPVTGLRWWVLNPRDLQPESEVISPAPMPVLPPDTKRKAYRPPKRPRLVTAVIGNGKGRTAFDVVQLPTRLVRVLDFDDGVPSGFRPPRGAFAKIKTDRGVQYLIDPSAKPDGKEIGADDAYEAISKDRESYDLRVKKKSVIRESIRGVEKNRESKFGGRRLIPLGAGREIHRGEIGKLNALFQRIEKVWKKGGGR